MSQFATAGEELLVGGVPLTRLAARVGRTPFYAYDRTLISERVRALRAALPASVGLHYAIKANPMPAVVGHLAQRVDGMDVASAGELKLALDAGVEPGRIGFAGPGKSAAELLQAAAAGVLVAIESAREVPLLAEAAKRLGVPGQVVVRGNPDFELKGSGM
ncbi:MAG: pyridoxal-dependent decarboxylase, exosortase A system-associated, partial [Proteobacteria bacterium]